MPTNKKTPSPRRFASPDHLIHQAMEEAMPFHKSDVTENELESSISPAQLSRVQIHEVITDRLAIPSGTGSEQKRFRQFLSAIIHLGGEPGPRRFIDDDHLENDERGCVAIARINKQFQEALDEHPPALANRTEPLQDGEIYLFSQNGKPELGVFGGNSAEKLDARMREHAFFNALKLKEIE